MKTAISLPDETFHEAERYARQMRKTRSELYSEALSEYPARHAPDEVTDTLNRVVDQLPKGTDRFGAAAARRVLGRTEW